jgi:hypothetical protein
MATPRKADLYEEKGKKVYKVIDHKKEGKEPDFE